MQNIKDQLDAIIKLFNNGERQKALNKITFLLPNNKKNINFLFLHAKICLNLDKINEANSSLEKILKLDLNNFEALKLIYVNYLKTNKIDLAKKYIDKLLTIEKNNYEFLRDKAFIEYLDNDYLVAEKYINKALKKNSEEIFGLNIKGLLYIKKNKILNAIKIFKKAILINPQYADSYNNLGKCYIDIEKLNLAYLNFKKSYKINPNSELPLINIANILSLKDKNKLAIRFYEKAKKINPNNKLVDENIDILNCRLKNFKWVEEKIQNQKITGSFSYELLLGYSFLLLYKKNFKKAFEYFDSRLSTKDFINKNKNHKNIINHLNENKEMTQSSKLLIVKEQGIGDEILFSSMYGDLLKKYKNVQIECDNRLVTIFNRSFKKNIFFPFGHFSSSQNKLGYFDKVLYAGSLTKYFRNNEDQFQKTPYLKTSNNVDELINKKLQKYQNNKKIGISWKSVVNIYGGLKSLKIQDFKKLISKNRTFINLQYGYTSDEVRQFSKNTESLYSFSQIDLFNDFESLLSILKNLDLFITVSNSTAHFAGALGVKTILICPKKSSTYYYWDYDNGKTPWYNNISIIKYKKSTEYTMNLVDQLIDKI